VEDFTADDPDITVPGVLTARGLIEIAMQVDICAEGDAARHRARRLAIISRSSIGVQHFNDWGLSILYADDAKDITFVGDANQWVRRWTTTLHLTVNEGISVDFPYFNTAKLARVENVTAHHKQ
jgi:hypothetical protein